MLNFLPIMLLSNAQKVAYYMLNIMPMTIAIILQFIYNFVVFNNHANWHTVVSLQSVML